MIRQIILLCIIASLWGCRTGESKAIDEDKLGFVDADVRDFETNLSRKAEYSTSMPGSGERIDRSFENAPPMIPHTTDGFFPITAKNNICLSCHMPDRIKESKAIAIPQTHFTYLRPKLTNIDGKYGMDDSIDIRHNKDVLNTSYFNCSQCHVPQANVSVDIENLFTPEFRSKNGLRQSNLKDKLKEGVK